MFDIDSCRNDVRDILENGEQWRMHIEVINEYTRLTTVLIKRDCS